MNFDEKNKYVTEDSFMSYLMRILIATSTALLICALFDYYQLCVWLFRKFETQDQLLIYSKWWPPEFLWDFIVEFSICIIHPVPYIFPNKIGIFMFLRLYLLLRLARDNSELYNKRGLIYKNGYRDRGGPPIDTELCVKNLVRKSPGFSIAVTVILGMSVFSYATHLTQREGYDSEAVSDANILVSTAFLIFRGSSRLPAYDTSGRMIEILTAVVGANILAFLIAIIIESLHVTPDELFTKVWLAAYQRDSELRVYAAELIQAQWRLHMLNKKAPDEVTIEVQLYLDQLVDRHKKFRQDAVIMENLSLDPAVDKCSVLNRTVQNLSNDVEAVEKSQLEMLDDLDALDDLQAGA